MLFGRRRRQALAPQSDGCGTHAGAPVILPDEVRVAWKAAPPEPTIARVAGGPFREWMRGQAAAYRELAGVWTNPAAQPALKIAGRFLHLRTQFF